VGEAEAHLAREAAELAGKWGLLLAISCSKPKSWNCGVRCCSPAFTIAELAPDGVISDIFRLYPPK
jgi:hypothetical protein